MGNITFELVTDENVEQCRELCNELMAFQASKGKIMPEILAGMNFDNRLAPSYANAQTKHLVVMKDDGVPVGYVYSTMDYVPEAARTAAPPWAPKVGTGFFPDWLELPQWVGGVNNLYIKDAYRKSGAGQKLFDMAMDWLKSFEDCKIILIHVSNGNENAYKFYEKNGFTFSHDVFGGFIKAVYKKI